MFGAGEKRACLLSGFIADATIGIFGSDGFDGLDGVVELGYERAGFGFGHCCWCWCLRL